MAYFRQYENGVGWENAPSTETPVNATNLNQMDSGIENIDLAVWTEFQSVNQGLDSVNSALANKQNTLTFDDAPTVNSDNPVKSGGIYSAIQAAVGGHWTISGETATFSAGGS